MVSVRAAAVEERRLDRAAPHVDGVCEGAPPVKQRRLDRAALCMSTASVRAAAVEQRCLDRAAPRVLQHGLQHLRCALLLLDREITVLAGMCSCWF